MSKNVKAGDPKNTSWSDDDGWSFSAPTEDEPLWPGEKMGDADPATSPLPTVEGTPLPAHIDDEVAAAIEDGPELWFGTRFTDIPPELKQDAWVGLRKWVDQFIVEHDLGFISPCWFQHPDVVNELYATMCAEYKVWEEGAPSVGPFLSFQTYLPGLKQRLRDSTMKFCLANEHKWEKPGPLVYNETDWNRTRDSISLNFDLSRDDECTLGVRAVVDTGTDSVLSNTLKIGSLRSNAKPIPTISVRDTADPSIVTVTATVHRDDASLRWEQNTGNDWVELVSNDDQE